MAPYVLPETSAIPQRGPEHPTKIYKGGCHCGKFAFECRHPVIEDGAFEVLSCNCSICAQRGYLFIYILDKQEDFKFTKGTPEELTRYRFYKKVVDHVFCSVCGCALFEETENFFGVNARTITGLDLNTLKLKLCNGRDLM